MSVLSTHQATTQGATAAGVAVFQNNYQNNFYNFDNENLWLVARENRELDIQPEFPAIPEIMCARVPAVHPRPNRSFDFTSRKFSAVKPQEITR